MSMNVPTPTPFKPAWDNPEKTVLLFETWVEAMGHYFLLARRRNAQGQAVDFDAAEKRALALIIGGPEIKSLFETVAGQVINGQNAVTYDEAVEAAREALRGRLNETSQVYALNKMEQGAQSFAQWYPKVMEAGKRIDWAAYNLETAVKNVLIFNCESEKLRTKAIAENLGYNDFIRAGVAMENSMKKAKSMGTSEEVRKVKENDTVKKLEDQLKKLQAGQSSKDKCKTCGRNPHPKGKPCFALKLSCHKCNGQGHIQEVCKKKEAVRYLSQTGEDSEEEVAIKRVKKSKKKGKAKKKTTVLPSDSEDTVSRIDEVKSVEQKTTPKDVMSAALNVNKKIINFAIDSGVKRNLINLNDWEKIATTTEARITTRRFMPYGVNKDLPVKSKAAVTIQARSGAKVETEMFIVESKEVESLLGRDDALRLGILKLCPEGEKRALEIAPEVFRRKNEVAWLRLKKKVEREEGERFSGGKNTS